MGEDAHTPAGQETGAPVRGLRDRPPGLRGDLSLTLDSIQLDALEFTLAVERAYAVLVAFGAGAAEEPSLGGKLLYAGELNAGGRALMVAGNISGAATLAATADSAAGKQAMRDGVTDFLVNSLDEGLRILKNEVRKRETVAVCIGTDPGAVEAEMQERGVVADLLVPEALPELAPEMVIVCWQVAAAPAQWLPKVDAIAMECVEKAGEVGIGAARRWLRQAPRYLGRMSQGLRVMRCEARVADAFAARVRAAVAGGEIGVEVNAVTR